VRTERSAGRDFRKDLGLLTVRAVLPDRIAEDRVVHGHDHGRRGAYARELLDGEDVGERIEPRAAVLLGNHHPEDPHLPHLRHELPREAFLAFPLRDARSDLALGKFANGIPDARLILGEIEVHGAEAGGAGAPPPPGPLPRRRRRKRRRRPSGRPASGCAPAAGGPAAGAGRGAAGRAAGRPGGRGPFGDGAGPGAGRRPPGRSAAPPFASPRPLRRRRRCSRRGSGVSTHPSSRCRNVTTTSGRLARARMNWTILSRRPPAGSPERTGIRSASKRTMRVHPIRRTRPSAAASSITNRSRSWSRVCATYSKSGSASRHRVFRSSRCFSPPSG